MEERIKGFFRKKETVREGKVLKIEKERKKESPIYGFSELSMYLGMVSFDRIPHVVERRYYIIKTQKGDETFDGSYNVQTGDDVVITETTSFGSTSTKIEKKY